MTDVLKKNLTLLGIYQPRVHEIILSVINKNYQSSSNLIEKILVARQDDAVINLMVTLAGEQHYLCEHEDPVEEAHRWVREYIDAKNKAEIVFGIGFGYHLEVLIKNFPHKKVLVIEPNIALFYQILCVKNLENIIKNSEIFLEESIDVILKRIYLLYYDTARGDIQCEPFWVYANMFTDLWENLRYKFIQQSENFVMDIATRRHFGKLWSKNYILNLKRIGSAANPQSLMGMFEGVPGILISAGPSLYKNVALLRDLSDRCVLAAAGTAVSLLQNKGITPHIMMGIDAGKAEAAIHQNVESNEIFFAYSNQVAEGSLEGYMGPKFLLNYSVDAYSFGFFQYAKIQSEVICSGPSVANTCFDLLLKMGCNPIILVGQDLALTDKLSYAGDNKEKVIDSMEDHRKEGLVLQKDIYGKDVYTKPAFIAMKNWFEIYFEKVQDKVSIINATEGGLNILNAKNMRLEDAIASIPEQSYDIKNKIKNIHETSLFSKVEEETVQRYEDLHIKEINRLIETTKKQNELLSLVERDVYHPSKGKKGFNQIVGQVSDLANELYGSFLYEEFLKNLISSDFFVLKTHLERATQGVQDYDVAKKIYIETFSRQNILLIDALNYLKSIFDNKKVLGVLK